MTEEKTMKPEGKVYRLNGKQKLCCIQIIDRVSTLIAFNMIICDGLSIINIPEIIKLPVLVVSMITSIIQIFITTRTPKLENDHDKKNMGYDIFEFILAILALVVTLKNL